MEDCFDPQLACRFSCDSPARPARKRRARRRRRKRHLATRCAGALAAVAAALVLARMWDARTFPPRTEYAPAVLSAAWDASTASAVEALAAQDARAQALLDSPDRFPDDVAALAARNPEALDFALAYPDIRDTAPAETVDEAECGVFPVLLQWDTRWGCEPYGTSILAVSGCGPTALSVVACGLTGDASLSPTAIARWAQGQGYADASGTSWDLMRTGCEQLGLSAQELPLTQDAVFGALADGQPIICSVRPGDFTTVGHFIVLTGVQDGLIRIVDPNSAVRSQTLWEYDRLAPQIKNLWAYTARSFLPG